jgi:hypothetical protein
MRKDERKRSTNGPRVLDMAIQQLEHSAAVVAPAPQVGGPALQPGQSRKVESVRAESWADVVTYALKGAVIGGAGLGLCIPFAMWVDRVPWYAPFVIAPAVGGLGILYSILNPHEWVVNWLEDRLQRDIDGDGQVGKVVYPVRGVLADDKGHQLLLGFDLEGPNANWCWHRFCKAVEGGRNFSETEATKRQGITPDDWKRIYQAFTAQQWLRPAGHRGTPELINEGPRWVKLYADTPPTPGGSGVSGRLYGDR